MKFINEIEKSVAESIEMDKKSTFSGKIYGGIGICCCLAAFLLSATSGIGFLISLESGVKIWLWIFYPAVILTVCGLFLSIKQRLRGRFMSANFSIISGVFCVLIMITLIIIQATLMGKVYVCPFVMP